MLLSCCFTFSFFCNYDSDFAYLFLLGIGPIHVFFVCLFVCLFVATVACGVHFVNLVIWRLCINKLTDLLTSQLGRLSLLPSIG